MFAASLEAFLPLFMIVCIKNEPNYCNCFTKHGYFKFYANIDLKEVGYFDFSKYLCYAGSSVIAIDFCFYLISLFSNTIVFQNFFNLIFLVVPVNEVPEMEHSFKKTEHRYVTKIRKNPKS